MDEKKIIQQARVETDPKKLILYHGTNPKWIDSILKKGIQPRAQTNKSNWNEVKSFMSREDMVYLTYCYALYFSAKATAVNKLAFLEVDVSKLSESNLYPDEDVIAQATANETGYPLEKVHVIIRSQLLSLQERWRGSLKAMGTISHRGTIPPEAIRRYVMINYGGRSKKERSKRFALLLDALEPTITIINFQLRGEYYRKMMEWFLGDRKTLPQYDEHIIYQETGVGKDWKWLPDRIKYLEELQKDRSWVTVVDCDKNNRKQTRKR